MIATLFEICLFIAVIIGIIHEEKIAAFEKKIYLNWRNKK